MQKILLILGLFAFMSCCKDEPVTPVFTKDDTMLEGSKWELVSSGEGNGKTFYPKRGDYYYYHFINKNTFHISWELDTEVIFTQQVQYEIQNKVLIITDGETKVWAHIEELSDKKLSLRNYQEILLASNKQVPCLNKLHRFEKAH